MIDFVLLVYIYGVLIKTNYSEKKLYIVTIMQAIEVILMI